MRYLITFGNSTIKAAVILSVVLPAVGFQLATPTSVLVASLLLALLLPFPVLLNPTPDWVLKPHLDLFKHLVFGCIFGLSVLVGYFLVGRIGLVLGLYFDLALVSSPFFLMLMCFKEPPRDRQSEEFLSWGIGGFLLAMTPTTLVAVVAAAIVWLMGVTGFWKSALLSAIGVAFLFLCLLLYPVLVSLCRMWNYSIIVRLNTVPVHVRRFLVLLLVTYVSIGVFFGCTYYLLHILIARGGGLVAITCAHTNSPTLFDAIYFSFVTLTTLGYGDCTPTHWSTKLLTVIEPLLGLGLLTLYLGWYLSSDKSDLEPAASRDPRGTDGERPTTGSS
jgi:hypothetical protein